jgi:hypothetical protein
LRPSPRRLARRRAPIDLVAAVVSNAGLTGIVQLAETDRIRMFGFHSVTGGLFVMMLRTSRRACRKPDLADRRQTSAWALCAQARVSA